MGVPKKDFDRVNQQLIAREHEYRVLSQQALERDKEKL